MRAQPCEKLYATDAAPDGAGGCVASITQNDWLALYDLAEEKGERVRLDWKGEEPPSNMHDGLAAAAAIAMKLNWTTMFSYRLSTGKHINLLELESLSSSGESHVKVHVHVGFWRLERKIELSKSQFPALKIGVLVPVTLRWNWYGCPPGRILRIPLHGRSRSIIGMHHHRSSRSLRPRSSRHFMPFRNRICSVNRHRPRRTACVRTLESSGVFSCSGSGSCLSTPRLKNVKNRWSDESVENQKKGLRDYSHTSCWPCDGSISIAPSWFSAPPGLTLWDRDQTAVENELLYRADDIERLPERALPLRGRDFLVRDVLLTTAQRYDVAVSEFENFCESETSMGSKSSSITVSTDCVISAFHIFGPALCQEPRTGTSRHSHFRRETLCASCAILWC